MSWNDGIRRKVRDNVNQASEVVEVHIDNVAGVKLPIFKSKHRDVVSDELTLARGGQQIEKCRKMGRSSSGDHPFVVSSDILLISR